METILGIHFGDHTSENFREHISKILEKGGLKEKYMSHLLSENSLHAYSYAYTSELVDETNNYQVAEQLGDLSLNKFIVWYIYERFPQLKCAEGVKIAARLRINYGSKNSFCKIAESLGFWDYITAPNSIRQRKKKNLLEDVFEAMIGTTETLLDEEFNIGTGYACVYKILKGIFDEMNISLKYEDLYDAKTRLKELFDIHNGKLGPLIYEETKEETCTTSYVYRLEGASYQTRPDGTVNMSKITGNYKKILLGKGTASLKSDAQQFGAESALKTLAKQGVVKYAPRIYAKFSNGENVQEIKHMNEEVLKICGENSKINELFPTKGKSKYQNKYISSALTKFCRVRDYPGIKACLKLGADPNVLDSDGMSALDNLLVGDFRPKLVDRVIGKFCISCVPVVHRGVIDRYFKGLGYDKILLGKVKILQDYEITQQVVEDSE